MRCNSRVLVAMVVAAGSLSRTGLADTNWVEQGPGPIHNGVNVVVGPDNPDVGAVSAILPASENAGILYIGTVNGGVWRSLDANSANPHWTPLTDNSLPALSIASLASAPVGNAIFAGTGSTSSLAGAGSPGFGIARTLNGGTTWQVLAGATFAAQRVSSLAPTALDGGAVVLAGTRRNPGESGQDPDAGGLKADGGANAAVTAKKVFGLYRSTNARDRDPTAVVFKRISGLPGSGLPAGGISAIAADPGFPRQIYAGLSAHDAASRVAAGVYMSQDGGATWRRANGAGATALSQLGTSSRILLSVRDYGKTTIVYAAVIGEAGALSGVFRSADRGKSWNALGVPSPAIFPGGQGDLHGAISADRKNANVVFIAGDRQPDPFPNANGCQTYSGTVFRGDASATPAKRWHSVVCNGAQGTSPHADARAMAFNADGALLEADDGGVYQLNNPDSASPKWASAIGNLRATEFHSIAYDRVSGVIFGGAQDNGTPMQIGAGGFDWSEFMGGDGGNVAVDLDQRAHPGKSLRYSSYYNLGFMTRSTWDAANNFLAADLVPLRIVAGGNCKGELANCDRTIPFYAPLALSSVDPKWMLIGTKFLYESANGGNTLTRIAALGDTVGGASNTGRPIVYGGRFSGEDYPAAFYVGAGNRIFHRLYRKSKIETLTAYKGGEVRTIAVNPNNLRQVVVLDALNHVWVSLDRGSSFTAIVRNLHELTSGVGTIAVYAPDAIPSHIVVIAGGFGMFRLTDPTSAGSQWTALGSGFPDALVADLQYDQPKDLLVAGTLGRGAWTLAGFFTNTKSTAAKRPLEAERPEPFGYRVPLMPGVALRRARSP